MREKNTACQFVNLVFKWLKCKISHKCGISICSICVFLFSFSCQNVGVKKDTLSPDMEKKVHEYIKLNGLKNKFHKILIGTCLYKYQKDSATVVLSWIRSKEEVNSLVVRFEIDTIYEIGDTIIVVNFSKKNPVWIKQDSILSIKQWKQVKDYAYEQDEVIVESYDLGINFYKNTLIEPFVVIDAIDSPFCMIEKSNTFYGLPTRRNSPKITTNK